jgi:hypothetical protein
LLGKNTFFEAAAVDSLWQRFLNDDPFVSWSRVWHLVVLQHWISENKIVE